MDVLLAIAHEGHLRNCEWVVRELHRRDHRVTIAIPGAEEAGDALRRLESECGIAVARLPAPGSRGHAGVAVRRLLDALHHLEAPLAHGALARERAVGAAPALGPSTAAALARHRRARHALRRLLQGVDERLGTGEALVELLGSCRPDVLAVTPLVELGTPQAPLVRAAHLLHLPSVALIASWDNLTMKGRLADLPDRILVWNEAQRDEAVELHGVPAGRIAVCGAWPFDHWFADRPAGRAVPSPAPIVYVGSSPTIAPAEDEFIPEWLAAVRSGRLERWPVVIRPHPLSPLRGSIRSALERLPAVAVEPAGADGSADGERRRYMEVLRGAAAIVGINTTALVEGAIAGRPTLAPLVPRFHAGQSGTLHFSLLAPERGGALRVSPTLEAHRRTLEAVVLDGEGEEGGRVPEFVRSFVRPNGIGVVAAQRVADEIEAAAAAMRRTENPQ